MIRKISYFFGLVFFVLFLALTALIKFNYTHAPVLYIDPSIQNFIHSLKDNHLLILLSTVIAKIFGDIGGAILAVIIAALLFFVFKQKVGAAWFVFVTGGSYLFNSGLKLFIGRVRPSYFRIPGFEHEPGLSFASGHSTFATVVFLSLFFIIAQHIFSLPKKFILALIALFLIFATMFSRVFLGVHYPTDTIGGLLEGLTFIAFTYPTYLAYSKKPHHYY